MKEGEGLLINGPCGDFYVHESERDIILIASEVRAEEHRGMIPCPWGHPQGLFYKSYVELQDKISGETLIWSDLSIHLIRDHGFSQGKGSPFRLEPRVLKQVFWSDS
jgi:hypothetical protein